MKKLLITLVLIPFIGIAQTFENLDYISPFSNGVAAIKKGNEWGFIDPEGNLIVDFRMIWWQPKQTMQATLYSVTENA
ncbi:WG repeat-containing protein [Cyclobacterium sp.]|jgi:hypothetical protein|uniref:WG repeat-containing protein n=1 Tax=Cyclobacterium sp. TaxID=1966343 RepID=UPI0025B96BFA|nr:WG repeat-containing protein [Cyclobacterium sp.]